VPQLGGNARAGSGWLVAEGDESDRSLELLRPEIGVLTNVDLDHHSTFASRAEVAELFERWLAGCGNAVRGDELAPSVIALSVPGAHNRRNAAAALAALELAGVSRQDAEAAIAAYRGAGRRLELRGEQGGVLVYDDYAHNPAKIRAALAGVGEAHPGARRLVIFQPHLFSRTRHLAPELAVALSAADAVWVTDVYPAREEPMAGVTGKLVVDALAERRPGMAIGWAPDIEDAAAAIVRMARAGDVVVTVGAGDVDRAGALVLEALGR
jgi:UDP-N-acetylmuramate--alanine ligase